MVRLFVIPKVGSGREDDPFRPKYFGVDVHASWAAVDYAAANTFLVGADVTDADHAFLSAQSDVLSVPPLDTPVGGNPTLNQIKNRLEQDLFPAHWITATTTWRVVCGTVARLCVLMQRRAGQKGRKLFGAGVGLDTVAPEELRSDLIAVGASFNLDTSSLVAGVTVRAALMSLASQLPGFTLMGEAI